MKIKIRRGCFESNSSSQHSCNIMMADDFEKWTKTDDLFLFTSEYAYEWKDSDIKPVQSCLYTKDEVIQFIKASKYYDEETWNEYDEEEQFKDYGFLDSPWTSDELEGYQKEFTTPNGEKIIVFGEYGYDY